MNALRSFLDSQSLLSLGWTLVLAVWQTAMLALVVWSWRRVARRAPAGRRYAFAWAGLILALALGSTTLWRLQHPPQPQMRTEASPLFDAPRSGRVELDAAVAGETPKALPPMGVGLTWPPTRVVASLAIVWMVGVGLLLVRLLGGLLLARRIVERAAPPGAGRVRDAVARLAPRMGVSRTVSVLESEDVEAPAVMGWRRPTLLLPHDIESRLAPELIEPIVLHELAHVRRRDPLAALVQGAVDALLFFCPGARYLSRQAHEARECCCDDAAVRACGDPGLYARALNALATVAGAPKALAALGVVEISLVDRIRRVLKGEAMPRMGRLQGAGVVATLAAVALTGAVVMTAAMEQTEGRQGTEGAGAGCAAPVLTPQPDRIYAGYAPRQANSPVSIAGRPAMTEEYVFDCVRVRNVSEARLISVTFVAAVEGIPPQRPVVLVESQPISVSLSPGEAADVEIRLVSRDQERELIRAFEGRRAQAFLRVSGAQFEDRLSYRVRPNPSARTVEDAFYGQPAWVSRALIVAAAPAGERMRACMDDLGGEYSHGAIVHILDEPGHFARCANGAWTEADLKIPPDAVFPDWLRSR